MLWLSGFGQQKKIAMQASLISPLQESRWHREHFPQCSFNYGTNSPATEDDDRQYRHITWQSLDLLEFFVSSHHICGESGACKCAPWSMGSLETMQTQRAEFRRRLFSSLVVKQYVILRKWHKRPQCRTQYIYVIIAMIVSRLHTDRLS